MTNKDIIKCHYKTKTHKPKPGTRRPCNNKYIWFLSTIKINCVITINYNGKGNGILLVKEVRNINLEIRIEEIILEPSHNQIALTSGQGLLLDTNDQGLRRLFDSNASRSLHIFTDCKMSSDSILYQRCASKG